MPDKAIDHLLQELEASGRTDSSGVFTISAEKARQKLAEFQLPEPRLYVLNVVASAVVGGASFLNVTMNGSVTVMEYDGEPLDGAWMGDPFSQLLNPDDRGLQEIAVALNALRAMEGVEVRLESWADSEGWRLDLKGDRLAVAPLDRCPWEEPGLINRLRVKERFAPRRAIQLLASWLPERVALEGRAGLAPLRLQVNARPVAREAGPGHASYTTFAWAHYKPRGSRLRAVPPDTRFSSSCLLLEPPPSNDGIEAVLSLGSPDFARLEGLILLCNGIEFTRPAELLGVPFASGVLSWGELEKNVSHTDLVENDAFRHLLERAGSLLDDLLVQRLESDLPLPDACLQPLLDWHPELVRRLRAGNDHEGAAKVSRWAKETRFMLDLESEETWNPIRQELLSLADGPEREAMAGRLKEALLRATDINLRGANYAHGRLYCARLVELGDLMRVGWREVARECSTVVRALCGETVDQDAASLDPVMRGTLLRLAGEPEASLPDQHDHLHRGLTLLALLRFEEAEAQLRSALKVNPTSPLVLESLSDCLSLATSAGSEGKREALALRLRAVELREESGFAFGSFLHDDVVTLAGKAAPFHHWVKARVRASFAGGLASPAEKELATQLQAARKKLRESRTGTVEMKSVLLAGERKFPPDHPFLHAARSKAAFYLRETGRWTEADDILARGFLLEHLARAVEGLMKRTDEETRA